VYHWPQKMFDGSPATFEMLKRPDTVVIMGIVGEKIMVIDDEQPHSGAKISFPGGRVDAKDASTLAAAQRETKEETGYEFASWHLLQVYQTHTKIEQFVYVYLAKDVQRTSAPHLDAGEKITVELLPFEKIKEMSVASVGYLGESREIFERCTSLDDLLALPAFEGKEVDR
jgi:ADP-ribose pyrophosphatase